MWGAAMFSAGHRSCESVRIRAPTPYTPRMARGRWTDADPDPLIRIAAATRSLDQEDLAQLAETDRDPQVRIVSVRRLSEQHLLVRLATRARDPVVRAEAIKRVTSLDTLEESAQSDKDWNVRQVADSALVQAVLQGVVWCTSAPEGQQKLLDAHRRLRDLADRGNTDAQFALGEMHASGRGVAQDKSAAAKWFSEAAKHGHTRAQLALGKMFASGDGVAADGSEAASWLRRAAAQGRTEADIELGRLFADGNAGPGNAAEAQRCYRAAGEAGNAAAQLALGKMFASGDGVAADGSKAASWLRRAAAQGRTEADIELGRLFADGNAGPGNAAEAQRCYRAAGEAGNAAAQLALGKLHTSREGKTVDRRERGVAAGDETNQRSELDTRKVFKRLFVSHSSQDASVALEICKIIELNGVACWIAPRDIRPGQDWDEEIVDAIDSTQAMLLILSGHANDSVHVKHEVSRAVSKRKAVLPIRIQDVLPSKKLALYVSTRQWFDAWDSPLVSKVAPLVAAVRGLLNIRED